MSHPVPGREPSLAAKQRECAPFGHGGPDRDLADRSPPTCVLLVGSEPTGALRSPEATEDPSEEVPELGLPTLARSLAASPAWDRLGDAILLVRPRPRPALAVMGRLDESSMARLRALRAQLELARPRLRYVDYGRAQRDAERLAARLRERFTEAELRCFRFTGIPRGGLIVLGMLAYALDLEPAQLEREEADDGPLVVVDDCALSGTRFASFLRQRPGPDRVVFAHLYSHPHLRTAIESREARVVACLAAHDLIDDAPRRLGEDHPAWKRRWRARSGSAYWVGLPEHVCFAWNEPDITFWNALEQRQEAGWRLLPPELCAKNRPATSIPDERIQIQPAGPGPWRPTADTLFGDLGEAVLVAASHRETCVELTDTTAAMWRALVEQGAFAPALRSLRERYAVDPETLRSDFHRFVETMVDLGLLEHAPIEHHG